VNLGSAVNWPIYWLDEVDSTNEEAKRRARQTGFTPQWISAHSQALGRGRLGRTWVSPKGNLYATALFKWTGAPRDMTRIPFATALAVADVIGQFAPDAEPLLKWPNDVRCNGAKVSGILVESGEIDNMRWVAAGIGINVGFVPDGVDQAATSLADLRGDTLVGTDAVLEALREAFGTRLEEAKAGFAATRKAWLERAEGLGKPVRVNVNGAVQEGMFADMGDDGALILQLRDGARTPIRAGDVELIKEVSS